MLQARRTMPAADHKPAAQWLCIVTRAQAHRAQPAASGMVSTTSATVMAMNCIGRMGVGRSSCRVWDANRHRGLEFACLLPWQCIPAQPRCLRHSQFGSLVPPGPPHLGRLVLKGEAIAEDREVQGAQSQQARHHRAAKAQHASVRGCGIGQARVRTGLVWPLLQALVAVASTQQCKERRRPLTSR